jgi:hypothetical protein
MPGPWETNDECRAPRLAQCDVATSGIDPGDIFRLCGGGDSGHLRRATSEIQHDVDRCVCQCERSSERCTRHRKYYAGSACLGCD